MSKIGRNEPCPCGSGKKYKQCCLRGNAEQQRRSRLETEAPGRVLAWLHERFGEQMQGAFRWELLGCLDDDSLRRLGEYSDGLWYMIEINGWELVLAEGKLEVDSRLVGCLDLVLGKGGPLLDAVQRTYLEKLQKASLSLYEVVESDPGVGFGLRDLIDDGEAVRWIPERTASQSLGMGSVVGLRLIPGAPWKLSGAIYEYPEQHVPQLLKELRSAAGYTSDPRLDRLDRSTVLVEQWLRMLIVPPPTIVDASSGEVSLLINDFYRVVDWDRLEAALEAQPDVVGSRQHCWSRLRDPDAEMSSTLLAINIKGEDRIEAFARSLTMADDGRAWLEDIAGDAIAWITREIIDPMSFMDKHSDDPPRSPARALEPSELPEDFYQQMYEQIYRDWADEPIPALGDRTPRQALEMPDGKRQVMDLLESYGREERKKAEAEGREVADLGFMWRTLGLEREAPKDMDAR